MFVLVLCLPPRSPSITRGGRTKGLNLIPSSLNGDNPVWIGGSFGLLLTLGDKLIVTFLMGDNKPLDYPLFFAESTELE